MTDALLASLVASAVSALSALFMVGMYFQSSREHERRLNSLDLEQAEQWDTIRENESKLANVRGQLGLNGQ